jgi:shikimate dehydrogenase
MGFAGLNITFPCKQAVIPLLDELSDEARAMGAVNTVVLPPRPARSATTPTARAGAGASSGRCPVPTCRAWCCWAAGGAGSAIAHALMRMQTTQLVLVDADPARARVLAEALNAVYGGQRATSDHAAQALQGPAAWCMPRPRAWTSCPACRCRPSCCARAVGERDRLLPAGNRAAEGGPRTLGCRVADGGHMAVGQAVGAFELFTGRRADPVRMDAHFRALVAPR